MALITDISPGKARERVRQDLSAKGADLNSAELGADEMKTVSGMSLWALIGACICLSAFGHVYYFGWLAAVAIPVTAAVDIYGARVLIDASKTKNPAKIKAVWLPILLCATVGFVTDHRGLVALNEWQIERHETEASHYDAQKAAASTRTQAAESNVNALQTRIAALPVLPSDPAAVRNLDRQTANRLAANGDKITEELQPALLVAQNALAEARAAERLIKAPRPILELSEWAAYIAALIVCFLKVFGFWYIAKGGAHTVISVDFRKSKTMPKEQSAALVAAGRGGKWRENYIKKYGPLPVDKKKA